MRFWDSSAVIPLLVDEATSSRADTLLREDPAVIAWWATPIECASAVCRLERDGALSADDVRGAFERMRRAIEGWIEVPASADVREQALRLLRVHRLRAADAAQLAAAIVASDFEPSTLEFVSFDLRQLEAADREGFRALGEL